MNFQLSVTRLIITACQEGDRRWVMLMTCFFYCSVFLLNYLIKQMCFETVENRVSICLYVHFRL